ncbi:MAG: MerR family transcriptional regulator, partial [Chloroflexi bacterium]|nr:MerR family transcriptional regulator [Chloroflexota bacterium]
MSMYTIKQLAELANVSKRTLRYYDQINLLPPSSVGANGYRYYDQDKVLRLQQIRFYQELDFSLQEIRAILDKSDFDVLQSLQTQKQALQQQAKRVGRLIETIDKTILHVQGRMNMKNRDLFAGFDDAKQKEYAKEASRRWDPKKKKKSNQRWNRLTADQKTA